MFETKSVENPLRFSWFWKKNFKTLFFFFEEKALFSSLFLGVAFWMVFIVRQFSRAKKCKRRLNLLGKKKGWNFKTDFVWKQPSFLFGILRDFKVEKLDKASHHTFFVIKYYNVKETAMLDLFLFEINFNSALLELHYFIETKKLYSFPSK